MVVGGSVSSCVSHDDVLQYGGVGEGEGVGGVPMESSNLKGLLDSGHVGVDGPRGCLGFCEVRYPQGYCVFVRDLFEFVALAERSEAPDAVVVRLVCGLCQGGTL